MDAKEDRNKRHYSLDGLNICMYQKNNVSLAILLTLVNELLKRNATFTCFFDANTRHKLINEDIPAYDQLLSKFPDCFTEITGGIRADDFILQEAESTKGIVISNDRFQDYIRKYKWLDDSPERLEERSIKGGIDGGNLMLPDLDINVPVNPDLPALIKSFQEFFTAKALARQLKEKHYTDWSEQELSDEVIGWLAEMAEEQPLWDAIAATRGKGTNAGRLGRNAAVVLGKMEVSFANRDLTGTVLSRMDFYRKDIRGTILRNTVLEFVFISGVSVGCVNVSPDGKWLASGGGDGTIRLWDVETGQPLKTLEGHGGGVASVAFSPDRKWLASGSYDRTIRLWDMETGQRLKTLKGHKDAVQSIVFSPDGKWLASGSSDETIHLWDMETGQHLKTLEEHGGMVWSVAFSPDGKWLASGRRYGTIRLWDVETGQPLKTLQGYGGDVEEVIDVISVAFSPDPYGKWLASGSDDGTICLWDVETGQPLKMLKGHGDWVWVRDIAFSRDGKWLASGSDDRTIRLWDVGTGQHLKTLEGHGDSVRSVAFLRDGKWLASGGGDGTIRLWDVKTGCTLRLMTHAVNYTGADFRGATGLTDWQKEFLRAAGALVDD